MNMNVTRVIRLLEIGNISLPSGCGMRFPSSEVIKFSLDMIFYLALCRY